MSRWRTKKEMKPSKNDKSKPVLVKLKSGAVFIGDCSFFHGKVHDWAYYRDGIGYVPMSEGCVEEDPVTHWKPLPAPEKLAEVL